MPGISETPNQQGTLRVPGIRLRAQKLTKSAFAPFGDVLEREGSRHYAINDGYAERYHDLAGIDVAEQGGRALVNIFHAKPRAFPMRLAMVERHPLSSQAFVPLTPAPFLVVVAAQGEAPAASALRAFVTNGRQGINYARGTWHHPLIVMGEPADFLVIDRGGPGANCDEFRYEDQEIALDLPPAPP